MSDVTQAHTTQAGVPKAHSAAGGHEFYIPSLDGIRAVAFMLVFWHHGVLNGKIPGGFGVTTFFFLSGYLITTLLRMEGEQTGQISLRKFYLRRVLRIFPPMYIAIVGAWATVYFKVAPGELSWVGFLSQALHGANYYQIWYHDQGVPSGTGVLWSLAVEEHFYLLFPLVYILLRRLVPKPSRQAAILMGICGCVLLWRIILVWKLAPLQLITDENPFRITLGTDTRVDSILFGCILAIWHNPVLDGPPKHKRLFPVIVILAVPLLLFSMGYKGPGIWYRETVRYTLQGISLFPLFIGAIVYHNWGVFRLLNLRWVKFLGVLSYSLYLVHYPILDMVSYQLRHGARELLPDVIALSLSLIVAVGMYYAVEKPCADLRKKLTRKRKTPAELAKLEGGGA